MTQSDERATQPSGQDVALIVGGGPGIKCAEMNHDKLRSRRTGAVLQYPVR